MLIFMYLIYINFKKKALALKVKRPSFHQKIWEFINFVFLASGYWFVCWVMRNKPTLVTLYFNLGLSNVLFPTSIC